mgnify:CR=1 FL=1
MNKPEQISEVEMLRRLQVLCDAFVRDKRISYGGEIIEDEKVLRARIKSLLCRKRNDKSTRTTSSELIYPNLDIKVWDKLYKDTKKRHAQLMKEYRTKLTKEELGLLIEIENVLCKRSRQIWGITHSKKIKGGGDITPYETGYDKLYAYMELVAKIIETNKEGGEE